MRNLLLVGFGLAACTPDSHDVRSVEQNELGISYVEIDHLSADHPLHVRGFTAGGDLVGELTIRSGLVDYQADGAAQPVQLAGTALEISVGDLSVKDVAPGHFRHEMAGRLPPQLATFVALRPVGAVVDSEAGITFPHPDPQQEVGYSAQNCDSIFFPTSAGGSASCCQENGFNGAATYFRNGSGGVGWRFINNVGACRNSDWSTGCTGTGCYYGPCGAHVIAIYGGSNSHIFVASDSSCGFDTNTGTYAPEPYPGYGDMPGVSAACDCSDCNSDGTATPGGCSNPF